MPVNPTQNGGYPIQEQGDNPDTWGIQPDEGLNSQAELFAEALHSFEVLALNGNYTLTNTNYVSNNFRRAFLRLTDGGLSAGPTVTAPAVSQVYRIINATGFPVLFETGLDNTLTLEAGLSYIVSCDGATVTDMTARSISQLSGPTENFDMNSFRIVNLASAFDQTDAVNLDQLQTAIANAALPADGGQIKITVNDTTARYASTALVGGQNINMSVQNPGDDETLLINTNTFFWSHAGS